MKAKRLFLATAALLLTALFTVYTGCKKDEDEEEPAPSPPTYTNGEGEVGPLGGTVMIDDQGSPLDGTSLIIPEGALTENVNIKITPVDSLYIPGVAPYKVAKFEPSGLKFAKEVTIILPYDPQMNPDNISVYSYNPDSTSIEVFEIESYDTENKLATILTDHFTYYTATNDGAKMDIEMLRITSNGQNQYIGVRVKDIRKVENEGISSLDFEFNSQMTNAFDFVTNEEIISQPQVDFKIELFDKNIINPFQTVEDEDFQTVRRFIDPFSNNDFFAQIGEVPLFFTPLEEILITDFSTMGPVNTWFSGEPLIFIFDEFQFDPSKEYFVKVYWELGLLGAGQVVSELEYVFKNKNHSKKIDEMAPFPLNNVSSGCINKAYLQNNVLPVVATGEVIDLFDFGAKLSCSIVDVGSGVVQNHGICFSESSDPDLDDEVRSLGTASEPYDFEIEIDQLVPNTDYYYTAYATNGSTPVYGDVKQFETPEDTDDPEILEYSPADGSTVSGEITISCRAIDNDMVNYVAFRIFDGNNMIFSHYDYEPDINDFFYATVNTSEYENGEYLVKANASDRSYNYFEEEWDLNFENSGITPTVITDIVSNITQNSALGGGTVTDQGSASVTERGVCWSTLENPTINDPHTNDGGGAGSFTSNITGLSAATTYYVRAYATNSSGTAYGNNVNFTTAGGGGQIPSVITSSISDITQTSAIGGGTVTDDGGYQVTARGVCWSTSTNPSINDDHTVDGSGTGAFVSYLTGLTESTNYYVKAYATNSEGTAYGNQVSFTTQGGGSAPVADFEGNPTSGSAPLTVDFTDLSTYNPTSWQWEFGDGETSSQQNPTHTYDDEGTYTVKLTVTNSYGSDYELKIDYITVTTGGGGEPCPGIPTVTYEGQVYNTVLIGSQCWLKENLNVGTMINGSQNQTNNGAIEKYCYNNNTANCDIYGGLYQWNEMMGYSTTPGVQGICPPGWHSPTDEEWKQLEGEVDSQYGYPDPEWDGSGWRGYDAGLNLKATSGWNSGGNGTDLYGFGALPGGSRSTGGSFYLLGDYGRWWSSSEGSGSSAWGRLLSYDSDGSGRYYSHQAYGRSVRCLQD